MGIRYLNRFLLDKCTRKSIHKIHLKFLENKTLVIDTSIYLYKFVNENALLENMYLFISILKHYKIKPIFIFDGKPPIEKKELLIQRYIEKKEAEKKYMNLKSIITDMSINNITNEEKKEIMMELENLKRQFARITENDITQVKQLMEAYGVVYYDAPSEADQLCAYLVNKEKAWGCISDDMDMFLYGCPYVIRNISLTNHTAMIYDTVSILEDLDMSKKNFIEIMVLSGTDYNIKTNTSLLQTMNFYNDYIKYTKVCKKSELKPLEFYVWLIKNTSYIENFKKLLHTYQMFQINYQIDLEKWSNVEIQEKPINMNAIQNIMSNEGFVFSNLHKYTPLNISTHIADETSSKLPVTI